MKILKHVNNNMFVLFMLSYPFYIKYIIIGLLAVLFVCVAIFVVNMIVDNRNGNSNFDVSYVERINL